MSEALKDIFAVINLQKAMPVYETRQAALKAIAGQRLAEPSEPLFCADD
jgi:hypothetical protein